MLPLEPRRAYRDFYAAARRNKVFDPKTTLLLHLGSAMAFGCAP